jgi:hypothetical protein
MSFLLSLIFFLQQNWSEEVEGGGLRAKGEMAQTMYTHMNK